MRLLILAALLVISGCNDSKPKRSCPPASVQSSSSSIANVEGEYAGYWQSNAYGRVAEVKWSKGRYQTKLYVFTQKHCLLLEERSDLTDSDLESLVTFDQDNSQFNTDTSGLIPGAIFDRVIDLPDTCLEHQISLAGDEGYTFDPEIDFEFFWQSFHEYYVDFSLTGTDWAAVYEEYKPEALLAVNEEALFTVFSKMVAPLQDAHIQITRDSSSNGAEGNEELFSTAAKLTIYDIFVSEYLETMQITPPLSSDQEKSLEDYTDVNTEIIFESILAHAPNEEWLNVMANDSIAWFITADNIGYIVIDSMIDYTDDEEQELDDNIEAAKSAIDAAIQDLDHVTGLVIDIRLNTGGFGLVSHILGSRFFDQETLVYSQQTRLGAARTPLKHVTIKPAGTRRYLGPIALLTSNTTASAGETFTLMLRERPNTTLVGEATAGAFSDIFESRVGSNIFFTLSNEVYLSPTGEWFEQKGVPVDIPVPFATDEQRQAKQDLGLETAIKHLINQ